MGHADNFDTVEGIVTWDGQCFDEGPNSYASLSNGWHPYFTGHQGCRIALDYSECRVSDACSTRVWYGPGWGYPNHGPYDDADGRVFWDDTCTNGATSSYATLSNGWEPHFSINNTCGMSFRWTNCGGLYENPVVSLDCPDPNVSVDFDNRFVLTCTSGNAADAFPLYVSTDLVHWTPMGHVLRSMEKPAWATSDFWAPEIHYVGSNWIAYFSARGTDGKLAIGAAVASDILGPYTALATPLVHSNTVGLIDATEWTEYSSTSALNYLVWKEDGNAINQPTPIRGSQLAADGLSLVGNATQLITNDQTWEGNLVEGPTIWNNLGTYYLFYSGNAYYDGRYAVGVAKASSPLGPYTKYSGNPIRKTNSEWVGPGHCSITYGAGVMKPAQHDPDTDQYMVYHAWQAGHVNGPGDGRMVLVDQIQWGADGWPHMYGAPSSASRPMP